MVRGTTCCNRIRIWRPDGASPIVIVESPKKLRTSAQLLGEVFLCVVTHFSYLTKNKGGFSRKDVFNDATTRLCALPELLPPRFPLNLSWACNVLAMALSNVESLVEKQTMAEHCEIATSLYHLLFCWYTKRFKSSSLLPTEVFVYYTKHFSYLSKT